MIKTIADHRWWAWLLPPRRQAITWRRVLPLALFLVIFIGAVFLLEGQRWVRFSRRGAFLLVALAPWVWWLHCQGYHGLGRVRGSLALVMRLVLLGLFVMLLAEPRAVRENDQLSVMYALDLSDSMSRAVQDEAIRYILETAGSKQEEDAVGLVLFGRDAAVELPPKQSFPFEAINSQLSKDATNLAKGLALASAVIPEENPGRIVLISDGTSTEGDIAPVIDQLNARDIIVDVLPVEMHLEKEAWLERIDLPASVKVGQSYEAHVLLTAVHEGSGVLHVEENGETIFREEIAFGVGKKRITLPIYLRAAGYYEYTARLLMSEGEDGWEGNNVAVNDLLLRGEGKTLVVTDPDGNPRDWENFVRALRESNRVVELKDAYAFPRTAISLMPYDSVVFLNVPADAFDVVQFEAVKRAVYNQGMGFLMVGGPNSFGPGGYHRTAIEETLPVSMDIKQKKILPKGALAIILHTCEFHGGNTWGKRIAKQAVRVLGDEDDVGIVDYEQGVQWIFPLTPAGDYENMAMKINQAQPGDMPSFPPAMEMVLAGLKANDAAMKHVIIISDGDPTPPLPPLIQAFVDARISISTIGISPHSANDTAILQSIAVSTGGRFYEPLDASQLPSIFIKEAKTLKRSMIQNERFTPQIEFPSPILKGIDATPELLGYVLTSAKPRSHTILKGPEEEEINPVLSTWRYGTGAAAAFTSDLSVNWGVHWVEWHQYRAFVSQLMTEISRADEDSDLDLQVLASGGEGVISVEDHHEEGGFVDVQARILGPEDREETLTLGQVAPRRYRATFPLWGTGRYQIMVAASGSNRSDKAVASLPVAYSPEYLQLHSNARALEIIAQRTGGRVLQGNETELFDFDRATKESSRSITDLVLLLLACLIPLDVGLRRVQIDASVVKAWFTRRKAEGDSGATMSALLKRKSAVSSQLDAGDSTPRPKRRAAAIPPPSAEGETLASAAKTPAASAPEADEAEDEASLSTTGRLLALKRKRQREKDDKP